MAGGDFAAASSWISPYVEMTRGVCRDDKEWGRDDKAGK
jgi:hypothetical protein